MTYNTNTYYSKNTNGKILLWKGKVELNNSITITTGQLNGKLRGINNRTNIDSFDKAVKKLKAKVKLKVKAGYKCLDELGDDIKHLYLSYADKTHSSYNDRLYALLDTRLTVNKTDANNVLKPMKAVQFKPKSFKYPAILQPKINGHRMVATLVKDVEGMFATGKTKVKLLTKSGHEYKLDYISDNLPDKLFDNNIAFDGEAYVHNETLSNIKRRLPLSKDGIKFSKNSLPSHNVLFMIFDLSVADMSQLDRIYLKDVLLNKNKNKLFYNNSTNTYEWYNINTESPIVNVMNTIIHSDEEAYKHLEAAINSGFEGVVIRSFEDDYHFGGRRTNMMKLKKSLSGEFKVLDVILKNKDNVRTYITFLLQNDINDKTFEATPEGNEESRQEFINNKEQYIGKLMSCTYYERTINDLPFHAVGRIREDWDLDKNDLMLEI